MGRAEIRHHHHISGPYLIRFAQEMAWREDHRKDPNGFQVDRVVALAMQNKPSVDFCGVLAAKLGLQTRLLRMSTARILIASKDRGIARSLAADFILFQTVVDRTLSRCSWPCHVISVAMQKAEPPAQVPLTSPASIRRRM